VASPNGEIETEPVTVEVDGDTVRLVLDDGTEVAFLLRELVESLKSATVPSSSSSVGSDK
jgi:hypothetical protein